MDFTDETGWNNMVNMWLVGGIPTPLKNRKVNWDDYSQYMGKFKMFQTINQPPMLRWQLPLHNKQLEAGGQRWLHAAAGR